MSDQLPAPDFDSQNYERPNEQWICGYAREGQACRRGPDHRGHCQATAECAPVLEKKAGEEKGRWRCTRAGGACPNGPLPDGSCARPITKCAPVPTLRTRRRQVTRAVVVLSIAALLILSGGSWRGEFINPNPISAPHSSVQFARMHGTNLSTCSACHPAGNEGPSGLISAAWKARPRPWAVFDLAHTARGEMTGIDQACQKCHPGHAWHQPNVIQSLSCSYCHAEHRGAGPIAATTDEHCSTCHGDSKAMLAASFQGTLLPRDSSGRTRGHEQNIFPTPRSPGGFTNVIHRFSADHPEFRVHADKLRDPNTLRFNHALHLTGTTMPALSGGKKLACLSCHQTDASEASFQRIDFGKHCQVCHALQFDPETPGLTLPHGDPQFVSAFLRSLPKQYADFAARSGIAGEEEQNRFARRKLEQLQARVTSGEDFEKRIFFSTATSGPETRLGSVSGAAPSLYPGCAYCHLVTADRRGQAQVEKPILPERWLTRAQFDHQKHSAVSCGQCHPAVTSRDTADVILPTKSSCVSCHSVAGGVRESCATCHSYHKKSEGMAKVPSLPGG